jgi:hypothetical protein
MSTQSKAGSQSTWHRWVVLAMAFVILIFSLLGFGDKFVQFVKVARGEPDGVFALTPIVNYLLASFGFLSLFGWAAANGMFHDIERPKYAMLEIEEQLDASAQRENPRSAKEDENDATR